MVLGNRLETVPRPAVEALVRPVRGIDHVAVLAVSAARRAGGRVIGLDRHDRRAGLDAIAPVDVLPAGHAVREAPADLRGAASSLVVVAADSRGRVPRIPDPRPERRLRIGYVSGDLRYHSVAFFIAPVIEQHDRENFEITCYANVARPDANTERLEALCDRWRDVASLGDAEVAAWIRRDEIDILVDLSGHTVGNRLPVFARKPAPVQVTYLGYPNTTGLDGMDYRLTDSQADPVGMTESLHSESLVRLEHGFLCFQPLEACPAIRDPDASDAATEITFGSFNELLKVTPTTVAAWCQILDRVPGSRLLIKGTTLGDEGTRQIVLDRFREHGIDAGRVRLIGRTRTLEEHLELYNGIDVALDTYPYNGTTTTCEALWMGVPVVTRCGKVHASRVGSSLLARVGLDDLVAGDESEYIEKAVALAEDVVRRRRLRGELRDRMRESPLMASTAFTRALESAYREMWRSACAAAESRSTGESDRIGTMSVRIKDGIHVRVPADLNELTPYVLLEQEDWFEDEIEFVRCLVGSGMRCLDIGANYGVFSLTLARRVGPDGRIWSFEPTADTARFLTESLAENDFRNVTLMPMALSRASGTAKLVTHADSEHNYITDRVANDDEIEIVDVRTLDDVAGEFQIQDVDFVKMDAEGAEIAILEGGEKFLESESPVLMFEVKYRQGMNWNLIDALQTRGFEIYRLVPGLQILVPFDRDRFDPYLLNLFAVKPDRARSLASHEIAVRDSPGNSPDGLDEENLMQSVLARRPYAAALWHVWREAPRSSAGDSPREWPRGLVLYCRAWDASASMSDRFEALCAAHAVLSVPVSGSAEMARLFSLARVSWELGFRHQAIDALGAISKIGESGIGFTGAEPFLAVSPRFDAIEPGNTFEQWCVASVVDQMQTLSAYSSYFVGEQALGVLEMLRHSPFQCAEMERRRQLVRMRGRMQAYPEPSPLLDHRSEGNLNPEFWSRGAGEAKRA